MTPYLFKFYPSIKRLNQTYIALDINENDGKETKNEVVNSCSSNTISLDSSAMEITLRELAAQLVKLEKTNEILATENNNLLKENKNLKGALEKTSLFNSKQVKLKHTSETFNDISPIKKENFQSFREVIKILDDNVQKYEKLGANLYNVILSFSRNQKPNFKDLFVMEDLELDIEYSYDDDLNLKLEQISERAKNAFGILDNFYYLFLRCIGWEKFDTSTVNSQDRNCY